MMTEKFNLKWNDFEANVSKSFGLFRKADYLHDVTLVSDDFKQVSAHKLVLSASSEYFQRLFKETKQSQPVIVLNGISHSDIVNVLDYVYEGEVRIHQEDLDNFLNVAQRLKLEGLLGGDAEDDQEHFEPPETRNFVNDPEIRTPTFTNVVQKQKSRREQESQVQGTIALNDTVEDTNEEVKQKIKENIITNEDGSVTCNVCKITKDGPQRVLRMQTHMQTHIEGVSYPCTLCDKTFRSKNSFNNHKSRYHRL